MNIQRRIPTLGGLSILAIVLTVMSGAVTGQAGGAGYTLTITAVACDEIPYTDFEEQCQPKLGATFDVSTEDDEPLGSCTTEDVAGRAICEVAVPFGITVLITEDLNTVPEGYVPYQNPVSYDIPVGVYGDVVFFNVLHDEDDPAALVEALVEKLKEILLEILA